jgi:sugar lactone lactonase YvrE
MNKKLSAIAIILALVLSFAVPAFAAEFTTETALLSRGAPSGLAVEEDEVYLVTDTYNKVVWRLAEGAPEVFIGRETVAGLSGEPVGGYNDGAYDAALFASPWAIAPYSEGWLISDAGNNALRYAAKAKVTTISAKGDVANPTGLAADDKGGVYIADTDNNRVRLVDKSGKITTVAGTGKAGAADGKAAEATFNAPTGLAWYDGALYIADTGNHKIRVLADGEGTTLAGVTVAETDDEYYGGGYLDGDALKAAFSSPTGAAVLDGGVFVSDTGNGAIRRIKDGVVSTVTIEFPGVPFPVSPRGLLSHDGRLLACDTVAGVVFSPFPVFDDVEDSDAYAAAVAYVYAHKLLAGTETGVFSPEAPLTRGALFTALGRLYLGEMPGAVIDGEGSFTDAEEGQYYTDALKWAADKSIVEGYNGKSEPLRNITREECAVALYKYAAQFYDAGSPAEYPLIESYPDGGAVSGWARGGVEWAIAAGILTGGGEELRPREFATRAEVAQMLFVFAGAYK